jgi:hypothetical protein
MPYVCGQICFVGWQSLETRQRYAQEHIRPNRANTTLGNTVSSLAQYVIRMAYHTLTASSETLTVFKNPLSDSEAIFVFNLILTNLCISYVMRTQHCHNDQFIDRGQ